MVTRSDLDEIMKKQRQFFATGATKDVKNRLKHLKKLKQAIKDNEDNICDALASDFGKSPFETYVSEIGTILVELGHTISHLKSWAKPKRGRTPMSHLPGRSRVYAEPYGTVLVIAPMELSVQSCNGSCNRRSLRREYTFSETFRRSSNDFKNSL